MCTVTNGYVFGIFIPLFFQNTGKKEAHEVIMFSVPTSVFVPADQFSLNFE
jgi:glycopeptide antibiotics resistance protein